MAAPTNAAKCEKSSCQPGAVHTWHFSDVLRQSSDVRCWGLNRPELAALEGRLLTRADIDAEAADLRHG